RNAVALDETHRAGVAIGQDSFGRAARDLRQAPRAPLQRVFPANGFKTALAFAADALHGGCQALRMMDPFRVAADFGTQGALRRSMVRVSDDLDRPPTLDGDPHCAGVGAIVRTNSASEF